MKLFTSLSVFALGIALTSCGGGSPTLPSGPATVTGLWTGILEGSGAITVNMNMTQSNQAGDFSGTLTAVGIAGSTRISGNVQQGTLTGVDSSGDIKCNGTFTNYTRYNATCILSSGGVSQYTKLSIQKR